MRNLSKPLAAIGIIFIIFTSARADKLSTLDERFRGEIRKIEAGLDGILGYAIKDIKTGKTYLMNEEEIFPQASSIKITILLEVFKQAEEGKLKLDEFIELRDRDKVPGSGILLNLGHPKISLSVKDICVLMIVLSDNTATNLLIEKAGLEAVNRRLASLRLGQTHLRRKMMDLKAAGEGRENISTPMEMMTLLEKIYSGQAIKDPWRQEMIRILALPKESALRSGVPEDVQVAEKPGELEAVRCDSGIVFLKDRPYIICVMTTFLKNDKQGNAAIEAVSRLAFEHFSRLQRSSEYGRIISEK
jgi:beta-lactamase class A